MHKSEKRAVVATADERSARLLEVGPTLGKALDVRELAALHNGHEREHERSRPDMMPGPGIRSAPAGMGAAGGPHMAEPSDFEREEARRFAREVARWLEERPERTRGDRLVVFSAPRFLGMLREAINGAGGKHLELREGELAQMPLQELREHAALREAVPFA